MTNEEKERLLIDFYLGELNEEHCEKIREELAASPELRKEYQEIVNSSLCLRWLQQDKKIDQILALKKLSGHWKKRTMRRRKYAAAASIILLAGISLFMLTTYQGTEKDGTSDPVILPGSSQAVLIVSTGEKIALSGQENVVCEADGTTLHIDNNGQISYIQDKDEKRSPDDTPLYNTIIVPRGGEYIVVLPDSSKVWLNSESELKYPVCFDSKREVDLKGEAYFEVRKSEKPFLVHSDDFRVKVYGTEFNLNTYNRESPEVVLVKGSVGFSSIRIAGETLLRPNQAGKMNLKTGDKCVKDVDVYPYIAWKNNDMVFFNETLEHIMEKTSRWYNVDVVYAEPGLKELRFSADIKRYTGIKTFLDYLEKTAEVKFTIKERMLYIQRK